MTRTQITAARAARVGATSSTRTPRPLGRVGTDLRARTTSPRLRMSASRSTKRSKGRGLGKSMRSGDGSGTSAWTASPYWFSDPKWSQTVSSQR